MSIDTSIVGELDRYLLLEKIGRGGYAIAFKALAEEQNRHVCVKVFHSYITDIDEGIFDRLDREVKILSQFSHPNIIKIREAGKWEGCYFLVLDYFKEGALQDELEKKDFLSLERATEIVRQVTLALEVVHREGFIHRDVKPSNILLSENRVVLSDFGIAKALGAQVQTGEEASPRTAIYMSPEQGSGGSIGPQTDVYSLGVVLYQMLTGTVPFKGENELATIYMKIHEDPPSPRELNPAIPKQVERVVLRALARDTKDRYHSAQEFANALLQATLGRRARTGAWRPTIPKKLKDVFINETLKAMFAILVLIIAAIILWYVFKLPLP